MVPVPPSWTTVKIPVERVVRVVMSSTPTPPRPRTRGSPRFSWTMMPPPPCTPWRLSLPCCWKSRTTLTCLEDWARAAPPGSATIRIDRASATECRMASARDLRFLGQLVPDRLPLGHLQAELLAQSLDLGGEGLADLVIVADLQPVLPVDGVLGRAGSAEDVHGADVPLLEGRLGFVPGRRVLGQPLDPVLAVPDVEFLLFEDPLDGPHPGAVGAAAHVLERVIEDVHALIGGDPRGADVGIGIDAHGEDLVMRLDVAVHVETQVGEQPVHHGRVPDLVLDDLRDHVLLLNARRLRDPRHVAVAAGQFGVGLHGQQMEQVLAVRVRHLFGGLDPLARRDPRQQPRLDGFLVALVRLAHHDLLSTTRTAFPSLRGMVFGGTMAISGLSPKWPPNRSAPPAESAMISGRPDSKPPQASTSPSTGST